MRERCPFFAIIPQQAGLQKTDCKAENGVTVPAFLRRAHAQSGFKDGSRRMQCDQKPGIQPLRVDFCRHPGKRFRCFPSQLYLRRSDATSGLASNSQQRILRRTSCEVGSLRLPLPRSLCASPAKERNGAVQVRCVYTRRRPAPQWSTSR